MTTSDPREALDRIKAREEARGYAVAHEDREAVRLTTIESQKDVGPLAEALEAVLALHSARWAPFPFPGGFICDACREPVESEPCATVRAIEAKLNEAA